MCAVVWLGSTQYHTINQRRFHALCASVCALLALENDRSWIHLFVHPSLILSMSLNQSLSLSLSLSLSHTHTHTHAHTHTHTHTHARSHTHTHILHICIHIQFSHFSESTPLIQNRNRIS